MGDWRRVSLEAIAEIRSSNVDKKPQPGEEPIRLCNYMDVYASEYITKDVDFMEATATPSELSRFRVNSGDVMITKDSETPDDIGVAAVATDEISRLVCGYHLALIKPNRDEVDPIYLAKQLSSVDVSRYFGRSANGSTRYGLSSRAIAEAPIRLAPLREQQRVGKILSTIDEVIKETDTLVGKIRQVMSGVLNDVMTRGVTEDGRLRPTRERASELYQDSPAGWIPKAWTWRRLDSVAHVDRGKFTVRPRNDPRYYNGEYPFIQTGNVSNGTGRVISEYDQTLNERGLGISRLFPAGTIMVTIAANIADTCILGIPMCAPDSVVGVVPESGEVTRYLELCIRQRKPWFDRRAPQTAQRNINLEELRPLQIPYPDLDEQGRIADRYEVIDFQLRKSEEMAAKLCAVREGLMQDLLSGRVRLDGALRRDAVELAADV